jgi:type II secretory pathway component PulM
MSSITKIREKVVLQAEPVLRRLDPLRARWDGATQRERRLILIAAVAFAGAFILIGVVQARASLDDLRNGLSRDRERLAQIEGLITEHADLTEKVTQLKRNVINQPVSTYVESKAREAGLADTIERIQNQRTDENDFFEESVVEVRLKKVSLQQLTQFMFGLEQSGQAARVQSLEVKPTFQDPRYLDVSMEVIGYRPLSGGR